MARRPIPPFETEITHLAARGVGVGQSPDGKEVFVRGAPPGSRVAVTVFKRKKGTLHARRTAMVRPPVGYDTPRCKQFGLCGGCVLQELDLGAQRAAKAAWAIDALGPLDPDVTVHPTRGAPDAYGYRNKVELSFGVRRYLSEADHHAGLPIDGRFLGFHAPGRFDRVVDAPRCELISEDANALLTTLRTHTLHEAAPPPYDVRSHEGFWRHAMVRQGHATGEILIALYTTSAEEHGAVSQVAEALMATPLAEATLVGVVWIVNDGVADVARGETRKVWGQRTFTERLGAIRYTLSPEAFFQTNTAGAEVLYDTLREATGGGGTLVDLYCGAGSIGLYLADQHDQIVGIEAVEAAVHDARANAEAAGIQATYHHAKVEEALPVVTAVAGKRTLIVDPPRAGLHPKVADAMAEAQADTLVYVACHPASLGRDRAVLEQGGWRCTDVWTIDLFPHTGHMEVVARFTKEHA